MTYKPEQPTASDSTTRWVYEELKKISLALVEKPDVVLHSPPGKPRVGLLVYADGVNWNPNSGEGFYEFRSDLQWHKL